MKVEEIKFIEGEHNSFHQGKQEQLHEHDESPALAMLMVDMPRRHKPGSGSFAQQCKKLHAVHADEAAVKEIQQ